MASVGVLIALAITAALGLALVATTFVDRQRAVLRARVHQVLDGSQVLRQAPVAPRLDTVKAGAEAGHPLLPAWLGEQIERAAGGQASPTRLLIVALLAIAAAVLIGRYTGLNPALVVLIAATAAIGAPYLFARYMKGRYDQQFLQIFPDALDLIVRAIKAGLPVSDALTTVSVEIADPVGSEFRRICDAIKIAVDLDHALVSASNRIRIIDFRFFVSALALQRQIGGNLAETLSNLSTTIRRRNEMKLKVKALSAEGRISAIVLSCLPGAVGALLYLVNPEFGGMLLRDPRGHKLLAIALVILVLGILTMRWMIKRAVR